MGDLITEAVSGTLYYLDKPAFKRVKESNASAEQRTSIFADMARLNTLYMIANGGSGHIGSSFSSMDVVSWLYLNEMEGEDLYFSSKGHDAPGLYAVLTALDVLPFDKIHKLRKIDGLPGHPDVGVAGMVTNTGSLGMGISIGQRHGVCQSHARQAGAHLCDDRRRRASGRPDLGIADLCCQSRRG